LAAGAKGNRAALPSSTIMMKQVISFPFVDWDNIFIYILHGHTVHQYLDDDSRIVVLYSSSMIYMHTWTQGMDITSSPNKHTNTSFVHTLSCVQDPLLLFINIWG
jgi:hypothetical protein